MGKSYSNGESNSGDQSQVSEMTEKEIQELKEQNKSLKMNLQELKQQNKSLKLNLQELKQQNKNLQSNPNFVGTVSEIIDEKDSLIIKKHGDNQELMIDIPENIDVDPGDRVSLNKHMSVTDVIYSPNADSRTRSMEINSEPSVTYEDIGGLDEELRELREATESPILEDNMFEEVGIEPPKGVLLYGPPGTGKTMMAKSVANKVDATFLKLAGSELAQKFIGEGSRLVKDIFQVAEENSPSIIFIDEIDAIATKRTKSKSNGGEEIQRTLMQLLSEMDGFENRGDVRIIGATNRYDMLDDAILRPGRFDRIIEVPKPSEDGREQIFNIQTRDMGIKSDLNLNELVEETEGFTGAEIGSICTEAGMTAIRNNRTKVIQDDFKKAIEKVKNDSSPVKTVGFE